MVNKLFEHIGTKVVLANPWLDTYSVNCIELTYLEEGKLIKRVVNLEGEDKQDLSINDISGSGFYIRINPQITYQEQRQLTSAKREFLATVTFRFVFYEVSGNRSKIALENKFANDFRQLSFNDYNGVERQIKLNISKTNIDANKIFKEETNLEYESGAEVNVLALDGTLSYLTTNENCDETCGYMTSENILKGVDFCKPEIIGLLSEKQKTCLINELCESQPGGEAQVRNSDDTYTASVDCGETLTLPDELFEFQIDSVTVATETEPTLSNQTFNINWT